jgi:Ti-type conjugative transfer relaxase TraA
MSNNMTGETYDYSKKLGVENLGIHLPDHAPEWARGLALESQTDAVTSSNKLWNYVEKIEKHPRAQFFREVEIALPMELSRSQNRALAQTIIDDLTRMGAMVDASIHWDFNREQMEPRPHLHLMMPMRPLHEHGFGNKKQWLFPEGHPLADSSANIRVSADPTGFRDFVPTIREAIAREINLAYAQAGHELRVSHLSMEAQGIVLEPTNGGYLADRSLDNPRQTMLRAADNAAMARNAQRISDNPELALDALTRTRSTFHAHDLARMVGRYFEPQDIGEVQRIVQAVMDGSQVVRVSSDMKDNLALFTTRTYLNLETNLVVLGGQLSRGKSHQVAAQAVSQAIESAQSKFGFKFGDKQNAAIQYLSGSGDLGVLRGLAGTGKTTVLAAAREAWEIAGYTVIGTAPSGIAAQALESEAGIQSKTIAGLAKAWNAGRMRLDNGTILVLDEAGMVGTAEMEGLLQRVHQAGAKIVLVGDHRQLQPIAAGNPFELLMKVSKGFVLDDIRRQRDPLHREASALFSQGDVRRALKIYHDQGALIETKSLKESYKIIAQNWLGHDALAAQAGQVKPGMNQIALSYTQTNVAELNAHIRGLRVDAGLVTKSIKVDLIRDPVLDAGFDQDFLKSFGVETKVRRDLGIGDWIVFNRNDSGLGVRNGTRGIIKDIVPTRANPGQQPSAVLHVALNGGDKVVKVDLTHYNALDLGYAVTIHRAQGATVDHTHVLATRHMDAMATYVAGSRHRDSLRIVLPESEFKSVSADRVLSIESPKPSVWEIMAAETMAGLNPVAPVRPHLQNLAQVIAEHGPVTAFNSLRELHYDVQAGRIHFNGHEWGQNLRDLSESLVYAADQVLARPDLIAADPDLQERAARAIMVDRSNFSGLDPVSELDLQSTMPFASIKRGGMEGIEHFFEDYRDRFRDMKQAERTLDELARSPDVQAALAEANAGHKSYEIETMVSKYGDAVKHFETARRSFTDLANEFLSHPETQAALLKQGYGQELKNFARTNHSKPSVKLLRGAFGLMRRTSQPLEAEINRMLKTTMAAQAESFVALVPGRFLFKMMTKVLRIGAGIEI